MHEGGNGSCPSGRTQARLRTCTYLRGHMQATRLEHVARSISYAAAPTRFIFLLRIDIYIMQGSILLAIAIVVVVLLLLYMRETTPQPAPQPAPQHAQQPQIIVVEDNEPDVYIPPAWYWGYGRRYGGYGGYGRRYGGRVGRHYRRWRR